MTADRHVAPTLPDNSCCCTSEPPRAWWAAHHLDEVRAARRNYFVWNDFFITPPSWLLQLPGILKHMPEDPWASWQLLSSPAFQRSQVTSCPSSSSQTRGSSAGSSTQQAREKLPKKIKNARRTLDKMIAEDAQPWDRSLWFVLLTRSVQQEPSCLLSAPQNESSRAQRGYSKPAGAQPALCWFRTQKDENSPTNHTRWFLPASLFFSPQATSW